MKRVLIYGGRGALGSACVQKFKSRDYWVGSIDMHENTDADNCVVVNADEPWTVQEKNIKEGVRKLLGSTKLDAIICVAGGWAGGNAASEDFIKNTELMWKQSVWSSTIAAGLATEFLREGGLLTLTGAHPALQGTPGMIGYGMAKAAIHHLTKSMAKEGSGLPKRASAIAVLPVTLDTPMNRKWMPNADTSKWTPLDFITEMFHMWADADDERPPSGSLVSLMTANNGTNAVFN